MYAPLDLVAREIGTSRRHEAARAAQATAVRLHRRDRRLQRRLARVSGQLEMLADR